MIRIKGLVLSIKGKKKFTCCLLLLLSSIILTSFPFSLAKAQGFNIASVYQISDKDTVSGDILISNGDKGLTRTQVSYDNRIFGVIDTNPTVVLREASSSATPVIRLGDVSVNVTDYNRAIKKGDLITSSPVLGKGMKAEQSGYVLGTALADADYSGPPIQADAKQVKTGTVKVALRIEFAELTTARNSITLLDNLNTAFFRSVQNPEKFTLIIRYIIAGLIGIIAFVIGFFTVARSISKSVEAIGRNPLARNTIMASVIFQIVLAVVGGIVAVALIYIIVRL